jgi:uncharacterized DUF497 family protein
MKKDFDFQENQSESHGAEFEFDPAKSLSNLTKHGIDFIDAQRLWQGPVAIVQSLQSEEPRWMVVGQIRESAWSAIITYRNEKIRIISVRRSRRSEKKIWRDHYKP